MNILKIIIFFIFLLTKNMYSMQLTAWNFDWDDNVLYMPTKIIIFDKNNLTAREITTQEFARNRKIIGISGEFEQFKLLYTSTHKSFAYFRDHIIENYFLNHIREVLSSPSYISACGPSFKKFQFALSHPQTAYWTTIITSRGHSPKNILAGLQELQRAGLIKYLPPEENIFTITSDHMHQFFKTKFNQDLPKDPALIKIKIMEYTLTQLNSQPLSNVAHQHYWGFSDDDIDYFTTAVQQLSRQRARWPHVKIALFYTGKDSIQNAEVILELNGEIRTIRLEEKYEFRSCALRQHEQVIA